MHRAAAGKQQINGELGGILSFKESIEEDRHKRRKEKEKMKQMELEKEKV